jgi:hypothetical protein
LKLNFLSILQSEIIKRRRRKDTLKGCGYQRRQFGEDGCEGGVNQCKAMQLNAMFRIYSEIRTVTYYMEEGQGLNEN